MLVLLLCDGYVLGASGVVCVSLWLLGRLRSVAASSHLTFFCSNAPETFAGDFDE